MDEFREWRGPIGLGHLKVLASAQGRVFRNNYAAVFVTEHPPNAARVLRRDGAELLQVSTAIIVKGGHRRQGHGTRVMVAALRALAAAARKEVLAYCDAQQWPEDVTFLQSKIAARGKANGHVVALLQRCASRIFNVRVLFQKAPGATRGRETAWMAVLIMKPRLPALPQRPQRRHQAEQSSPSPQAQPSPATPAETPVLAPATGSSRRYSARQSRVCDTAGAMAGVRRSGMVRALKEYIELQSCRAAYWSTREGEPCCCGWLDCDAYRANHRYGNVVFPMEALPEMGGTPSAERLAQRHTELLKRRESGLHVVFACGVVTILCRRCGRAGFMVRWRH